jgi:LacI family trehalose operon transcriptional repressor
LTEQTEAIVCASDTLALGVIKRLQELNREDVVVTGVGGNELLSFLFPKVFSIDPGYSLAGEKAANLLISHINGEKEQVHLTQEPLAL